MKKIGIVTLLVSCSLCFGGCHPIYNLYCEVNAGMADHRCTDFFSNAFACPSPSVLVDSCPTTNVLGTCDLTTTAQGAPATAYFYSDNGTTAAEGQAACEAGSGTWKAQN